MVCNAGKLRRVLNLRDDAGVDLARGEGRGAGVIKRLAHHRLHVLRLAQLDPRRMLRHRVRARLALVGGGVGRMQHTNGASARAVDLTKYYLLPRGGLSKYPSRRSSKQLATTVTLCGAVRNRYAMRAPKPTRTHPLLRFRVLLCGCWFEKTTQHGVGRQVAAPRGRGRDEDVRLGDADGGPVPVGAHHRLELLTGPPPPASTRRCGASTLWPFWQMRSSGATRCARRRR